MDLLLVLLTFIFVFSAGVFVDGSGSDGLSDREVMAFVGDHGEALLAIQMDLLQQFPWLSGEDYCDKGDSSVVEAGVCDVPGQGLGVVARRSPGVEAGVCDVPGQGLCVVARRSPGVEGVSSVAGLSGVPGQFLGVEASGAEAAVHNSSLLGVEVDPQVQGTLRVRVSSLGSGRSVLLSIDSLSTIGEWNGGVGGLEDDVWDDMEVVSGKHFIVASCGVLRKGSSLLF